ncbi:Hypothetical predicted protein [Octopus vulgaris]|uniref:Uncharacterized protein n=1 Tax=Octopus vulgaris TaxID=6645 RepID=A0AA36BAY0_OCTVU|nr:Hypothetical predicted protein [Octopus vulgaris]
MPQKSNTSDKTLNEDILKELKNINSQLLNLNNKIEESNLLARESKSNEDATRYTNQLTEFQSFSKPRNSGKISPFRIKFHYFSPFLMFALTSSPNSSFSLVIL